MLDNIEKLKGKTIASVPDGYDAVLAEKLSQKKKQDILYILSDGISMEKAADMLRWLKDLVKAEASSHLASVAAVALADSLISRVLFGETRDTADMEAADMAMQIFGDLKANEVPDVNVSACRFISDWLAMNPRNFGRETADSFDKDSGAAFFGWITGFGDAYILPTPFKDALEREGYNYRKTVKYLVDQRIVCAGQGNTQTIVKKQGNRTIRVYRVLLDKLNDQSIDRKASLEEFDAEEDDPFVSEEGINA